MSRTSLIKVKSVEHFKTAEFYTAVGFWFWRRADDPVVYQVLLGRHLNPDHHPWTGKNTNKIKDNPKIQIFYLKL